MRSTNLSPRRIPTRSKFRVSQALHRAASHLYDRCQSAFLHYFGADSFNKNLCILSDQNLFTQCWEKLIGQIQSPGPVNLVEIVTWNDYGSVLRRPLADVLRLQQPACSPKNINAQGEWLRNKESPIESFPRLVSVEYQRPIRDVGIAFDDLQVP
ncbi:hypothetical protein C8F01DRAFT_738227 [Mycena amicta]|nr:hypothetical protein C8F01DRAFT_738227 [Mycena amicta]